MQKQYKVNKVAIIDFDVHHGNGTQEIFYKDPTVAYGSSHEFPLFPGTGAENETGVGNIFNATLKAGTARKDFFGKFDPNIFNLLKTNNNEKKENRKRQRKHTTKNVVFAPV